MKRGIGDEGLKRIAQAGPLPEHLSDDEIFFDMAEVCSAALLDAYGFAGGNEEECERVLAILNRNAQPLADAILKRLPGTY